ncbi:NitT/TauT family transport system ATP-binding protein [Sphingobacterium zeae]|uniref:NitT/TauT family transport system ATP-binding protein n=1 Tax=Sphingobacterium zeae TaxID=1776859 RepID=A0ABU0UC28_9SPHI|nr:ABC transporter ATP-binding protein [Sphingobacterium zeae]MDQ1152395.1 NitT/TauT family transport system ATP-binding protein [Sphingobacterium zeae]
MVTDMNKIRVQLSNVSLKYNEIETLINFNLQVIDGEFLVILGPSGCGKTSILNLISGYLTYSSGSVVKNGAVKTVFQQGSLFPWLTVSENIAIALKERKVTAENKEHLNQIIEMVNLGQFKEHYPHQLSGGMKQRAELARVLIGHSDILLMDEPFSSLDYLTRLGLRRDLLNLLQKRPKTVILVTHDIEEAVHLADRIIILSKHPSNILKEIRLNCKHPRKSTDPKMIDTVADIMEILGINN